MKERIYYIDNLKGFAISLVVIGHVIQFLYCPKDFDHNILFRFIYAFHMPLFFMLSGMVTRPIFSNNSEIILKIKKRFIQLISPFVIWGIILSITIIHQNPIRIFIVPDTGLWFLLTLFEIYLIHILVCYWGRGRFLSNSLWEIPLLCFCTYFTIYVISKLTMGLGNLALRYYPYFAIGAILYFLKLNNNKRNQIMIFAGFFFIILGFVWYRLPSKIPINAGYWVSVLNNSMIYKFITSIAGCLFFVLYFHKFHSKKTCILYKLGRITLSIYIYLIIL